MNKFICDVCKTKEAKYHVKFLAIGEDSLFPFFENMLCPKNVDICKSCYKENFGKGAIVKNCETCANKGTCSIHDNYNIAYCSDYEPIKPHIGSSAEKNKR